MKTLLSILLLIIFTLTQKKVEGQYYDNWGNTLIINSDSTFIHRWHFDLAGGWSKGKWIMKNKTIYFTVIPIFDTLRIEGKNDTLILAENELPQLITNESRSFLRYLTSGGQNKREIDSKLYFRNNKLYRIDSLGKLQTKKVKGFWNSNKTFNTWFVKK